jgi:hypothetical protein
LMKSFVFGTTSNRLHLSTNKYWILQNEETKTVRKSHLRPHAKWSQRGQTNPLNIGHILPLPSFLPHPICASIVLNKNTK